MKSAKKAVKPDGQKPIKNNPGVHTHMHPPKEKSAGQKVTAGTKVKGAGLATKKKTVRY